jgi:hypothetical protein
MSILRRIPLRKVNLTLLFNVFSIVLLDVHAHPFFFFFFFFWVYLYYWFMLFWRVTICVRVLVQIVSDRVETWVYNYIDQFLFDLFN